MHASQGSCGAPVSLRSRHPIWCSIISPVTSIPADVYGILTRICCAALDAMSSMLCRAASWLCAMARVGHTSSKTRTTAGRHRTCVIMRADNARWGSWPTWSVTPTRTTWYAAVHSQLRRCGMSLQARRYPRGSQAGLLTWLSLARDWLMRACQLPDTPCTHVDRWHYSDNQRPLPAALS